MKPKVHSETNREVCSRRYWMQRMKNRVKDSSWPPGVIPLADWEVKAPEKVTLLNEGTENVVELRDWGYVLSFKNDDAHLMVDVIWGIVYTLNPKTYLSVTFTDRPSLLRCLGNRRYGRWPVAMCFYDYGHEIMARREKREAALAGAVRRLDAELETYRNPNPVLPV